MGGRGSSGGVTASKSLERQSAEYLESRLKTLGDRMDEFMSQNRRYLGTSKWEEVSGEYYKIQGEYAKIRDELGRRTLEKMEKEAARRRSEQPQQARTFVNAYGEATTREITSPTYNRAMRRQEQAVLRNMGVTQQQTTTRRRRRRKK